jgi:hypothetical protein
LLILLDEDFNVPLILKVWNIIFSDFESPGNYFFVWGKTYNGAFLGFFEGALLRYTQDNLGVKKVSAPSKNPAKMPHYMFCPRKKNHIPDFQNQRCINSYCRFVYAANGPAAI